MTTVFVAAVFIVGSIAVAALGFASLHSDIQMIIAIMGVLFAGLFLVAGAIAGMLVDLRRSVEDIADEVRKKQD